MHVLNRTLLHSPETRMLLMLFARPLCPRPLKQTRQTQRSLPKGRTRCLWYKINMSVHFGLGLPPSLRLSSSIFLYISLSLNLCPSLALSLVLSPFLCLCIYIYYTYYIVYLCVSISFYPCIFLYSYIPIYVSYPIHLLSRSLYSISLPVSAL